jgi:nicotinamide riboside kinase
MKGTTMPFDNYSEDDYQAFAEEMNRPQFREKLQRAIRAADEIIRLINEAEKRNPNGLIF